MKINKLGKYRVLEDRRYSGSYCSFGIAAGTIITVTQIDGANRKFYSPSLEDWQHWEQPFEKVE